VYALTDHLQPSTPKYAIIESWGRLQLNRKNDTLKTVDGLALYPVRGELDARKLSQPAVLWGAGGGRQRGGSGREIPRMASCRKRKGKGLRVEVQRFPEEQTTNKMPISCWDYGGWRVGHRKGADHIGRPFWGGKNVPVEKRAAGRCPRYLALSHQGVATLEDQRRKRGARGGNGRISFRPITDNSSLRREKAALSDRGIECMGGPKMGIEKEGRGGKSKE